MIKKHSFANPFPSIRQKFGKNGRSNSAPGAFDVIQVNKSFVNNIKNIYKPVVLTIMWSSGKFSLSSLEERKVKM